MASWATLCCGWGHSSADDIEDDYLIIPNESETSRLWTPGIAGSTGYTTPAPLSAESRRFTDDSEEEIVARLGSIVRTKENKMVKIGPRPAFTLHPTTVEDGQLDTTTTPSKSPLHSMPSISSLGGTLQLPFPPPPSPATPRATMIVHHSHLHEAAEYEKNVPHSKFLPRRPPIPPVFTLSPAPAYPSAQTTPAVSRSSSVSGSQMLRRNLSSGSRKGSRVRVRGRMSSGGSRDSKTHSVEESEEENEERGRMGGRSCNITEEQAASDVSDASGLTFRGPSTLTSAMSAKLALNTSTTAVDPASVSLSSPEGSEPDHMQSSLVFTWGE
ncbi:hypothetical protein MIND_01238500 [Mycena indigotica]|uniref:Uncharacterized protein n=1 Tax=Mycena indigotica TaxID=2126181 RepID=A0A8H6S3K3_9AGAR|nr:uncharacterized protein MIND_01238500 [Mycena indigotica]KAF7292116.1 hypothetical protein MIND_01238500 [Mycena indigotica]